MPCIWVVSAIVYLMKVLRLAWCTAHTTRIAISVQIIWTSLCHQDILSLLQWSY
jgi:hypothetical protein